MKIRNFLLTALTAGSLICVGSISTAFAGSTIKIGEINTYSKLTNFTIPYRNGWKLALEEINQAGGIHGKKLEVISRDDAGKPGKALTIAEEMVRKDKVSLIMGSFFSHVGLALTDFSKRNKVFYLSAEPLSDAIVWSRGHRYTFRLRPSTYMQAAMLAEQAAKNPATRWATIAPNYAYGKDAVKAFKMLLKAKRPDVEFVAEQWPALFKIKAGVEIQALAAARPQAIYNVTFGGDLAKFVREGQLRNFFQDKLVVSQLTGEPEYMDPLKGETPKNWIVTGYPWEQINTPEHNKFLKAYQTKFNDYPRLGSVVGYSSMMAVANMLKKANSTDTEKMVDAMEGLSFLSPVGPVTFRAIDHQSTMGGYVGRTTVKNGRGVMVDWKAVDGKDYLPSDAVVRTLRRQ